MNLHFPFDNSYARLPQRFFARIAPTPVRQPRLIRLNAPLAIELGFDPIALGGAQGADIFAGNEVPKTADPIATAYAGNQFGGFVPQLGDGRAILLGEVVDANGVRRDLQLKGAGPTPFSRRGDGRAALGPVLREYLVSETMAVFGIPTTRALAAVLTGETVVREELLPGAVLTRIASSHIRVGTFQYFASRDDSEGVRILAEHVIARHYPATAAAPNRFRALLNSIVRAQAELIAQWLLIGFVHGVMNTDNMSIAGETIDYGPCAFLDEYNPGAVWSAIDRNGRYAYANQPSIVHWNLTRLAECFLPLLAEDSERAVSQAEEALGLFAPIFEETYHAGLRRKLGLATKQEDDAKLGLDLLELMAANRADYTLTFRGLSDAVSAEGKSMALDFLPKTAAFEEWEKRWRVRLSQESTDPASRQTAMRKANPLFIPRNHRVEAVIRAGVDRNDFAPFEELLTVLSKPFEDQPEFAHYALPPEENERVCQTFCGT